MSKSCLIIGYGSIGRRHAAILSAMGCRVSLLTSQHVEEYKTFSCIQESLNQRSIEYIVIANPTHKHNVSLQQLLDLNFSGYILVEKPLFSKAECILGHATQNILVGYNLRFHQLLLSAKELITNDDIISFSAKVGQYLPSWRKNIDYQNCYSAKKEYGGGVLRELSHELDYTLWFCGNMKRVVAMGGHYSELDIDSEDVYSILMSCEHCPIVNLEMDFLSRVTRREITIQTSRHTIIIDLIAGEMHVDGELREEVSNEIARTYINQHHAILSGNVKICCDFRQGLSVVHLIEMIELSLREKRWVGFQEQLNYYSNGVLHGLH